MLPDCSGGVVDDPILGRAPVLEREVEAREAELDADHVGGEHPQRLLEKFLPGLVAFENDDRLHVVILLRPMFGRKAQRCFTVVFPASFF